MEVLDSHATVLDPPLVGWWNEIGFDGASELGMANKLGDQEMEVYWGYQIS